MGKLHSEIEIIDGYKVLTKFSDLDLDKNGSFVLPKDIDAIGEAAFCGSKIKSVKVNDKCKYIINTAFIGCTNLESISLPNSLKDIGNRAFEKCSSLKSITIPEGIESISERIFEGCSKLEKVILPKNLKKIYQKAFYGCEKLTEISLPSSVKTLEESCFYGCKSLTSLNLPNGLETIEKYTFRNCLGLQEITIPETVKNFNCEFRYCTSLKKVEIKAPLSKLPAFCFNGCIALEEVILPNTLKEIEEYAFSECVSLKKIDIPNGVEKIGEHVFSDCSSLTDIELPPFITELGSCAFGSCKSLTKVNLPENLQSIGEYCFYFCDRLQEINIPGSIKKIPSHCFYNCNSLQNVEIGEGIEGISVNAFTCCDSLREVNLPKSIEYMADFAFYSTGLKKITINGTKTINKDTFFCSDKVTEISLPQGIDNDSTFEIQGFDELEEISYKGKVIKVDDDVKENFSKAIPFYNYAIDNKRFIPKNIGVLTKTKPSEIESFYKYSKRWQTVLSGFVKNQIDKKFVRVDINGKINDFYKGELEQAATNLYQACVMLGLFQDGQNGLDALDFITNNIITLHHYDIHKMFDSYDTKKVGYNEEFAKFYIKNYTEPEYFGGKFEFFMFKKFTPYSENNDEESFVKDYGSLAYNDWEKIKEVYPNKSVIPDREQASENNNLTLNDIITAVDTKIYKNVLEGNEDLAELIGKYGYSQEDFEILQQYYEEAKKIKDKVILATEKDTETEGVRYELLEKDDIESFVLGDKTNCCQKLHGAGEECMVYGATKANSGFVKFMIDGKLVGQSWVWYNEETKEVCLDNIEIPTIWLKKIEKKEGQESFLKCLSRLADGFKSEMEKQGHEVKKVTIGAGYNDLAAIRNLEEIHPAGTNLPQDYNGYSDATSTQYVVPILEKKTEKNTEKV